MRRYFHRELDKLRSHLVLMGERSIEIVHLTMKGFSELDPAICDDVLQRDDQIDDLENAIDREAVRYISLRAPVASDLRLLTVAMKVSHELERVGDEATSIAKRTRRVSESPPVRTLHEIPRMATMAQEMLRDAMTSFLEESIDAAYSICRRDFEVDERNRENNARFIRDIASEPEQTAAILELIFISKSLERIADHATNIAEEVIYLFSGQEVRHDPSLRKASS